MSTPGFVPRTFRTLVSPEGESAALLVEEYGKPLRLMTGLSLSELARLNEVLNLAYKEMSEAS